MAIDSQGSVRGREGRHGFRWGVLSFLGLNNGFNVLFVLSLGILLPSISHDLGLSPSQQGALGSSSLFGNLLFALPSSILLSRLSGRMVLLGSLIAMGLFALGQAWAPVFLVLLLSRLFFGLAAASMHPARTVLINQWFPPREVILANGIFNGTYGPAAVLALVLTPYLLLWLDDSWKTILAAYSIAILGVAAAWTLIGFVRRQTYSPSAGDSLQLNIRKTLGRHKELWIVGLGMMGMNLMWSSFVTFWPTMLLEDHDISLRMSGFIFAFAAILEGLGSVTVGYLVARWGRSNVMGPAITVFGAMIALGAVGMASTGSIPWLIGFAAIHGIGFSLVPFVWTLPYRFPGFGSREIAVAMGFIETCLLTGGAIGPALTGFIQESTEDLQLALLISSAFSGAIVVAGLVLTAGWVRRRQQGPEP